MFKTLKILNLIAQSWKITLTDQGFVNFPIKGLLPNSKIYFFITLRIQAQVEISSVNLLNGMKCVYLWVAGKKVGLAENAKKTKFMLMSSQKTTRQKQSKCLKVRISMMVFVTITNAFHSFTPKKFKVCTSECYTFLLYIFQSTITLTFLST